MQHALPLHRLDFSIRTATGLRFPVADRGFKGSAWHGRLDHAIRRHPALAPLLPDPSRSGAPSRYWIEAPEDRSDGAHGPFTTSAYLPGHTFALSIFLAGVPLGPGLVQGLTEALDRAGAVDPAQLTDVRSAAQRLSGRFEAQFKASHTFPLSLLQPPPCAAARAALSVEFHTMLRLDDGDSLSEASEQLRLGALCVPRLSLLATKVFDRCQGLGLGADAPWLLPALRASAERLGSHEHQIDIAQARVYPCDLSRLSARAGRRDPLGGLLGSVVYLGPGEALCEALTVFKLAEWTRIGRKTGLGAGRIRAELHA